MEKVIGKIPYAVQKVCEPRYVFMHMKKVFAETS